MPRKDPITGCMVMTRGEFWAKEAEREGLGRSGGELEVEMYEEMDREEEEYRLTLYNPEVALKLIVDEIKVQNKYLEVEDRYPVPVKVLFVVEVGHYANFRESGTKLKARVKLRRGSATLEMSSWYSGGSFYEPPDGDTEISIVRD